MHPPSKTMNNPNAVSKFGNHGRKPEEPPRRPEFDQEYDGKTVRITLHNGGVVVGRAETSKYWLKIRAQGDRVLYINKAYIVMIEPAE